MHDCIQYITYVLILIMKSRKITRPDNLIKFILSDVFNSTFAGKLPLYKFSLIWNRWYNVILIVSLQSHFKKQLNHFMLPSYSNSVNALTKDAEIVLETRLFSKIILEIFIKPKYST